MSGSQNVLHVLSHDAWKSGGAMQAVLLARAQRARGDRVSLVVNGAGRLAAAARDFAPLAGEGIAVHAVPMGPALHPLGARLLRAHIRRLAPDVVHAHRERAVRLAVAALRGQDGPPIVAQKGSVFRLDARSRRAFTDRNVHAIVGVAEAVRAKLIAEDGLEPRRCHVVYGSFDPHRFGERIPAREARAALGLPESAPVVGILANLDKKKGHDDFFAAAGRVLGARPETRFVVIGGGDLERARALAEAQGAAAATLFTGFRRDPERCLAACDVVTCTSRSGEGLTGALREALALGVAVVSTDVGGNRELVIDGETGRLVPKADPEALAGALLWLLEDPARRHRLAEAGRRRVHETMSEAARLAATDRVYDAALASAREMQRRAGAAGASSR